jgi:hypothetical protein
VESQAPGHDKDWGALIATVWIACHAAYFVLYVVVTGFDPYVSRLPMPLGLKIYAAGAGLVAWIAALKAKHDIPARQYRRKRLIDLAVVWTVFSFLSSVLI